MRVHRSPFRTRTSVRSARQALAALLALALLGSAPALFPGCSQEGHQVTLEFWTLQLSPQFNDYFHTLIAAYEQEHPGVRVRWVDVPYDAAIQKLLSSAVAGNAPDVVNLSADFLSKFHAMGALADLAPALRGCPFTFLPNALELCTFEGAIAGLPWYLNTYVVLYNRGLLREGGFTEGDLPSTFDGLVRFIRSYKDRTGKFALFWNIGKDSYLPMMLGSEGVPMTDDGLTHATFDTRRGISLVDAWVRLYREGYLQSESIIKPGSQIVEAYQSGQVLMIFTGPVFLNRVRNNAPAIFRETGVAPAIVGATGKHELAAMSVSVLSTSPHQAEATEFALFVTHPANQLAFSKLTNTFPSVLEALRDTFFTASARGIEPEARRLGASQLPHSTRLRSYLQHRDFDLLRDAFDEAVQKACLGSLSTEEALRGAAARWNVILGKRGR
jgi:putative chitobiose transport system substrate-binding protein